MQKCVTIAYTVFMFVARFHSSIHVRYMFMPGSCSNSSARRTRDAPLRLHVMHDTRRLKGGFYASRAVISHTVAVWQLTHLARAPMSYRETVSSRGSHVARKVGFGFNGESAITHSYAHPHTGDHNICCARGCPSHLSLIRAPHGCPPRLFPAVVLSLDLAACRSDPRCDPTDADSIRMLSDPTEVEASEGSEMFSLALNLWAAPITIINSYQGSAHCACQRNLDAGGSSTAAGRSCGHRSPGDTPCSGECNDASTIPAIWNL